LAEEMHGGNDEDEDEDEEEEEEEEGEEEREERGRRGNHDKAATNILKRWFNLHSGNPYPSEDEKLHLAKESGLTMLQISNWFTNQRKRAPR